jgi:hypothetical protein
VTLVSFACQTGTGTTACTTTAGAQFPTQVALALYRHSTTNPTTGEVTPGTKILTFTKTVNIGFRPSADPTCANPTQYKGSDGVCHNGARQNIVFNFPDTKLPATVVWGVTYNTDNQGPNPIGGSGHPQDSLNVGLNPKTTTCSEAAASWWASPVRPLGRRAGREFLTLRTRPIGCPCRS